MRTFNINGEQIKFKHASTINHGIKTEGFIISEIIDKMVPGGVFYDVGACHGLYSIAIKKCRPDIAVVAFEPHDDNLMRMKENADLNDVHIHYVNEALSNEISTREFTTGKGPGVHRLSFDDSIDSREVPVNTLDNCIYNKGLAVPDVLKIDVEGAEWQVLEGAKQAIISGGIDRIYIEIHLDTPKGSSIENYEGSEEEIMELLKGAGYTVEIINERKNTYHVLAY